jgi:hypothetical protein
MAAVEGHFDYLVNLPNTTTTKMSATAVADAVVG